MNAQASSLETLQDIRKMMEKSSRFISLSGWSGVAAGICGLAGAFVARSIIQGIDARGYNQAAESELVVSLSLTAVAVFVAAFASAFLFTYLRSRREGVPIWGHSAQRLIWNTMIPMAVGAIVILKLITTNNYFLIAPSTLIFYGLALVNGSKYTFGEIRYLGYIEIILGIINLWYPELWLLMWALGFGAMHIVYGIIMWWRHERK